MSLGCTGPEEVASPDRRVSVTRQLTPAQFTRLAAYGVQQDVCTADVVFAVGDADCDLIAVESGWIELLSPATHDEAETRVALYGPGGFVGELNLLTGQVASLTARVVEPGRIYRISPVQFRRVMADDPEVSDVLLQTFRGRRDLLRAGAGARGIEILGSGESAASLALRTYAARQRLPHVWLDVDGPTGRLAAESMSLTAADLPVVITPGATLRRATPTQLAQLLGLSYRHSSGNPVQLTVIGSGPAGLAAAVYGASEGLHTIVLDAIGIGGQAAASSRIENYPGFPSGISGADLTQKTALQALKFGAELSSPSQVVNLDTRGEELRVILADGTEIDTRAVLIATGARYCTLPLPRWSDFEGAGIYYAATDLEVRACNDQPVTVVGGANSAAQAALYLAARASHVTLAVRSSHLSAGMSTYLISRLVSDPRITIALSTEVTVLAGTASLDRVTLTNTATGDTIEQPCQGLFCFIGAEPATTWLTEVALDTAGFIPTDVQLDPTSLGATWTALGRNPLPFETNVPGVFAAGDVRVASLKRVASAIGEGASAVRFVHTAIGLHP
jgi:thioredoxin reductase (NADPH)